MSLSWRLRPVNSVLMRSSRASTAAAWLAGKAGALSLPARLAERAVLVEAGLRAAVLGEAGRGIVSAVGWEAADDRSRPSWMEKVFQSRVRLEGGESGRAMAVRRVPSG